MSTEATAASTIKSPDTTPQDAPEITFDSEWSDIEASLTPEDLAEVSSEITDELPIQNKNEKNDPYEDFESIEAGTGAKFDENGNKIEPDDDGSTSDTETDNESETDNYEDDSQIVDKKGDEKLSAAFLKLARREKEINQQLAAERQKLSQEKADLQAAASALNNIRSGDPDKFLAGLAAFGVDFGDMAMTIAASNDPSTEHGMTKLQKEIENLKQQNLELARQRQYELQQARANQYVSEYNAILKQEKYQPLVAYYDLIGDQPTSEIGQIYDHFLKNENRELTPNDMADILLNEATSRLKKISGKKEIASLLNLQPAGTSSAKQAASAKSSLDANNQKKELETTPDFDDLNLQERNQYIIENWLS